MQPTESAAATEVTTPAWSPGSTRVVLGGVPHVVCPHGGPGCCRVSARQVGDEWAREAIDRHIELHHRAWR